MLNPQADWSEMGIRLSRRLLVDLRLNRLGALLGEFRALRDGAGIGFDPRRMGLLEMRLHIARHQFVVFLGGAPVGPISVTVAVAEAPWAVARAERGSGACENCPSVFISTRHG